MENGPERHVTTPPDDENRQLLNYLSDIIGTELRPRSNWALKAAADAAHTEGLTGIVCIHIPLKCKDFPDVIFAFGEVDIVPRWKKLG